MPWTASRTSLAVSSRSRLGCSCSGVESCRGGLGGSRSSLPLCCFSRPSPRRRDFVVRAGARPHRIRVAPSIRPDEQRRLAWGREIDWLHRSSWVETSGLAERRPASGWHQGFAVSHFAGGTGGWAMPSSCRWVTTSITAPLPVLWSALRVGHPRTSIKRKRSLSRISLPGDWESLRDFLERCYCGTGRPPAICASRETPLGPVRRCSAWWALQAGGQHRVAWWPSASPSGPSSDQNRGTSHRRAVRSDWVHLATTRPATRRGPLAPRRPEPPDQVGGGAEDPHEEPDRPVRLIGTGDRRPHSDERDDHRQENGKRRSDSE